VTGRFVPDRVGHGIGAVGHAPHAFGQGQRRALGIGEVRRVAPCGHGEQALVGLAGALHHARVHVAADAAAVDLAGAQVDQVARPGRQAAVLDGIAQRCGATSPTCPAV
jgi:hypothetical protein